MPAPWEYAKILQRAQAAAGPNATKSDILAIAAAEGYKPGLKINTGAKIALGATAAVVAPSLLPFASVPTMTNSLQPGSTPGPLTNSVQWASESGNSGWGQLTDMGCQLLPDARLRAACLMFTQRGGNGNGSSGPASFGQACPEGYKWDGQRCRVDDIFGGRLPGDIGLPDFAWQSVNGRYGAGYMPATESRTVRRCPPGAKLGNDGVCYDRIARTRRAHNPGARPFLTGGEVNVLRRAKALNRRKSKLLGLFPRQPKPCATKRRKR